MIVKYYPKVFETHIDRFVSLFRSFLFSSLRLLHLRCVFTDDSTYYTDATALLRRLRPSRYIELLVGVRNVSIPSLRRRLVTCRHQLCGRQDRLYSKPRRQLTGYQTTMQNLISYSKSLNTGPWLGFDFSIICKFIQCNLLFILIHILCAYSRSNGLCFPMNFLNICRKISIFNIKYF